MEFCYNEKFISDVNIECIKVKTEDENNCKYLSETNILECLDELYNYCFKGLYDYCTRTYYDIDTKPGIFIKSSTGKGKTHFIINDLREYCLKNKKKILYLVNRDAVEKQVKKELLKYDDKVNEEYDKYGDAWLKDKVKHISNVSIMTYQKFYKSSFSDIFDENYECEYAFCVCDETHFFLDDSKFNGDTYQTLIKILEKFKNVVRIYMSATPDEIIPVLSKEEHLVKVVKTYYCIDCDDKHKCDKYYSEDS